MHATSRYLAVILGSILVVYVSGCAPEVGMTSGVLR